MRVLIVASYRSYSTSGMAPFVKDQAEALGRVGISYQFFLVNGKGIKGYLSNFGLFKSAISSYKPDLIHAHFGLCGLFANLQRKVPVVTTYHGSDINTTVPYRYSKISILLSKWNIFVSEALANKAHVQNKYSVIPCGIDISQFYPMDKTMCRQKMGLSLYKKYILFSKMFTDPIKNYPLAKAAVDLLGNDVVLLEFVGYTREQSAVLMNAVDSVIMTSISEGSPQFIKEAMACSCPIVSVDVGDVKKIIADTDGCFIVDGNSIVIADALKKAISYGKTNGHLKMSSYNNVYIAHIIKTIYEHIIKQ